MWFHYSAFGIPRIQGEGEGFHADQRKRRIYLPTFALFSRALRNTTIQSTEFILALQVLSDVEEFPTPGLRYPENKSLAGCFGAVTTASPPVATFQSFGWNFGTIKWTQACQSPSTPRGGSWSRI